MARLTEIQYLRRKVELLQRLRDSALAINDELRLSKAGDCFTYEGGMNDVELFRQLEARIVWFEFELGPDKDD